MNLTIENHRYYNFKEVRGFDIFLRHPSDLLKNTLEDFFSVEVVYDFAPLLNKDRKSTRLNSSHATTSRMPSSA